MDFQFVHCLSLLLILIILTFKMFNIWPLWTFETDCWAFLTYPRWCYSDPNIWACLLACTGPKEMHEQEFAV